MLVKNLYVLLIVAIIASIVVCVLIQYKKQIQQLFFVWISKKFDYFNLSTGLGKYKREIFSSLKQLSSHDPLLAKEGLGCVRLLEIGIGGGSNFKYYPNNTRLIALEPNSHFEKFFEKNRRKFAHIKLEKSINGKAEDMRQIESESVDVVVSTHVLCSVDDVNACLREIRRVLVANGKFIYAEHVAYPVGTLYQTLQALIEPLWRLFSDDCRLNVNTGQLIRDAQFSRIEEQYVVVNDLFITLIRPHIFGIAYK